jgi:hypothetical protein
VRTISWRRHLVPGSMPYIASADPRSAPQHGHQPFILFHLCSIRDLASKVGRAVLAPTVRRKGKSSTDAHK